MHMSAESESISSELAAPSVAHSMPTELPAKANPTTSSCPPPSSDVDAKQTSPVKAKVASSTPTLLPPTSPLASRKRSNNHSSSPTKTRASTDLPASLRGLSLASPAFVPRKPSRFPVPAWLHHADYANDPVIPVATRLGQEMLAYCEYTHRVMEKLELAIEDAIWNISECVQAIWPDASVSCYGSFANGLWLPSSDVDVVVLGIPVASSSSSSPSSVSSGAVSKSKKHKKFVPGIHELHQIAASLRAQSWVQQIDVVGSAKVPVAKLVLANGDLRVDISIENDHTLLGIEASDLVREYITAMPVLHPLVVVLKQFLREKGLNNAFTGGLSSYCVTLMAVYLVERQQATAYSGADVGQLLLDFLEFYGTCFNYATTGISLKPEAFGEYFLNANFTTIGSDGMPLLMPQQLVIDDPVYHDGQHNAAAGAFAIARVMAAFENAFYAVSFHRVSQFTPSPLSQLLHWSGYTSSDEMKK